MKRPVEDEQSVEYLVDKGLSRVAAEILCARGISASDYDAFVADTPVWHSPFEMANMDAAAEKVRRVMEDGGRILIYGDYDADGLTASSILSLYFSDNGVANDVIIPTRDEGYGLHAENVFRAFEKQSYALVITVDCGISNAEDVAKILQTGVEVIVTDHHELPSVLPDCICVNPKLGYPYPYLSGAGVAWKLVEALAGRDVAANYSELACIGTIGDIMPMRDENRAIVKLGLANFNHKSLKKLAELSNCSEITAIDVAMKIAPKINAAGRVGSPLSALSVLLARDKADVRKVNELLQLNEERKRLSEAIMARADEMCDGKRIARERLVFLYGDDWQHGLLGIVASRYKEKYKLPAVAMTKDGDIYVGSARGIDGINLFEIFSQCKDCLVKFGGHQASVGFSVAKDNVETLRAKLVEALKDVPTELFERRLYYDAELGKDCSAREIVALTEKLQPMLPQDKILCRVTDSVAFANSFGKEDAHLAATLASGLEIKGFKYGRYAPLIKNGANVDLICSLDIDSYTNNICGILEDMTLCNSICFDGFYKLNLLKNFTAQPREFTSEEAISPLLQRDGTAVVFDDYETYLNYCDKLGERFVDVFFDSGADNVAVISPVEDYDFSRFDAVIYFARQGVCRDIPNAIYVTVRPAREDIYQLDLNRDVCAQAFYALKHKGKYDSISGVYDKYLLGKMSYAQYVVALRVFEELNLITIEDKYGVSFNATQKRDLAESTIFSAFQKSGER